MNVKTILEHIQLFDALGFGEVFFSSSKQNETFARREFTVNTFVYGKEINAVVKIFGHVRENEYPAFAFTLTKLNEKNVLNLPCVHTGKTYRFLIDTPSSFDFEIFVKDKLTEYLQINYHLIF